MLGTFGRVSPWRPFRVFWQIGGMRIFLLAATVLMAGEFWADKPSKDWSAAEKERLLNQSPWAKPVSTGLDLTKGAVNNQWVYMPGQVGERAPNGIPAVRAVVRWESAAPVREAVGKPLPEEARGRLVLSVTMTGPLVLADDGQEELLRSTSLHGKGRLPMNPEHLLHDTKAGTIYFIFAATDTAKESDREWVFETTLGAMTFKTRFTARDMRHLGKTAL